MNRLRRSDLVLSLLVIAGVSVVQGCAGPAPRADEVSAPGGVLLELRTEENSVVVDAVRETLMDFRFGLDRIDAKRGVITTHPKRSAGLATPWDGEQSSLGQEWEDLLNEQQRVVRVEFGPALAGQGGEGSLRVTVELLRTHRPYWRVESESVRQSTHARSRDAQGQREAGSSTEIIGLDTRLADRIAQAIDDRVRSAAGER
jgi:hypothetical protein